jgi:hypothetical protein
MDTTPTAPDSAPPWQFSLKHLLLWLGAASVLLAPAHYFGGTYLFSIACSVALIFVCVRVYAKSRPGVVFVSIVGLFFGFIFAVASTLFAAHAFFNFIACIVLPIAGLRSRHFAAGLVVTMLAVYGLMLSSAIVEVRKLEALKDNTPFESLAGRLAYEEEPTLIAASNQTIQLTDVLAKKLNIQDGDHDIRRHSRAWALEQLHEHTATQFARAAGFGVSRMPYVTPRLIELEPRMPLTLPANVSLTPLNAEHTSLESLHETATYNFVDPERMAYIRTRDEVSGFESHGLASLDRDEYKPNKRPDWQVTRLELVSLLRHKEPRVYVAKTLPAMDQLADIPSRQLNSFEQSALPQLTTQKNVVVNDQHEQIEMLGALRAGTTCLECHHGNRGKLLGAFSYTLVPLATTQRLATVKDSTNRPMP